MGYLKDPYFPQISWFLGIYLPLKISSNYLRKVSFPVQVRTCCRHWWGQRQVWWVLGWSYWGLRIRGGISFLRIKHGQFSCVQAIIVSLELSFSFCYCEIPSAIHSSWVFHSCWWAVSLWCFSWSLLCSLLVLTQAPYAQLSAQHFYHFRAPIISW